MSTLNILISGSGVAGPVLAFFLLKLNPAPKITIIERSPSPRKTGQAIDIRGPAVEVIRSMGLEATIKAHHTTEKGLEKIDSRGNVIATLDSTGNAAKQSFTSEFEILRGDLAAIFTDRVKDDGNVDIIYGESIRSIDQSNPDSVTVTFVNGTPTSTYDAVIGADGTASRVRALLTSQDPRDHYIDFHGYTAFFTIPRTESDSPAHARFYNASGRRSVMLRPTHRGPMGALLLMYAKDDERLRGVDAESVEGQKRGMREVYEGAGWETERVLRGMEEADNFYMSKGVMVKIPTWSRNRIALLGDAAHSSGGLTGAGTSLAIYGAYILAGEIATCRHDLPQALRNYETTLRPYVDKICKVPFFVPWLFLPETWWGVAMLNWVCVGICWITSFSVVRWLGSTRVEGQALPVYEWGGDGDEEMKRER